MAEENRDWENQEKRDSLRRKIQDCEDKIDTMTAEINRLEERIWQQQEVRKKYQQVCGELEDARKEKENRLQQMAVYHPYVRCAKGYGKQADDLLEGDRSYRNQEQLWDMKERMTKTINENQQKLETLREQVSICCGRIRQYSSRKNRRYHT